MAPLTLEQTLKNAVGQLQQSGSPSAQVDAQVLLCFVLGKPRSYLLTWPEKILSAEEAEQFNQLMQRRLTGEPVAYLVGEREFWSLPLKVSPATLIPRPDTERLVELALVCAQHSQGPILDLGTGTGAIALALAHELPQRTVIGVDLMLEAQALATQNGERLGIKNAQFRQGSWFEPIDADERFDVIVSNPPYIDPDDPHLSQGDVRFEPLSALVAQEHGLADLRYISEQARSYLKPNGWLLFEHGYDQGEAVRNLLTQLGYQQVRTEQDYAGNDRVTLGCYI
ncbi:peptide chain release factor N(5)-glutamine methyltransferase [Vibrio sp. SM6]|uniref:Release factor glutamine methyltransferase n=1 Tax=Vibrio agarilyticus TaxID=2726741 RepID=A0A7X8YFL6_9VIBR|nr:peptide chain release factor N(5)-glutamine methyltransferase [Vibrio agarilyticus]NLS11650.1 peptide chain release factor N(5)-glutamine methyltransferase [Vibrio agarilyticus]